MGKRHDISASLSELFDEWFRWYAKGCFPTAG